MNKGHCRTCKFVNWIGEGQTYCSNSDSIFARDFIKLSDGCKSHFHVKGKSISQKEIDKEWKIKNRTYDDRLRKDDSQTPNMYGIPNH